MSGSSTSMKHSLRAGIELDGAGIGLLADDLLVDLRFRRHVDDEIAHDPGLAGKAASGGKAAQLVVALLDLGEFRDMRAARCDAVLGEFALAHVHLAAPADGAPAADRVDVDAQRPRRLQHRRSTAKRPRLPEGVKTMRGLVSVMSV